MAGLSRFPRGGWLADAGARMGTLPAMVLVAATVFLGGPMRADMIELSTAGLAALRENHLVEPQAHADGKGWFIEGQIVVLRDETDQPVLHSPWKYFMFHPLKGPFIPTGPDGKPKPDAKEVRLEFAWTHGIRQEIDTLDDVRGMISNRDLRFSSGAEALAALLADIDPQGALGLKKTSPQVADATIMAREGWLSRFLINGPDGIEQRKAEAQRINALPHDDPLSQNPNDPRQWLADGNVAMGVLLEAMARCNKWGEPEPGLKASCLAVAHFICGSIYVVPSEVPVGSRAEANRLYHFVIMARFALLSSAQMGSLPMLSAPPRAGEIFTPTRLAASPDSAQPVTMLDEAQAALEVLDSCRTPAERPAAHDAVRTLLQYAAGRADFRAAGNLKPLRPELADTADAIGRRAFEILLRYATVAPTGAPENGIAYRNELRPWLTEFGDVAEGRVAREVLTHAGLGSEAEIPPLLDSLFYLARSEGPRGGAARDNVIFVLKRLPGFIADANLRSRFQADVNQRIDQMGVDLAHHQAQIGAREFLDQYAATP